MEFSMKELEIKLSFESFFFSVRDGKYYKKIDKIMQNRG